MSEQTSDNKWSIGIDLGTTHCALSYRRPGADNFEQQGCFLISL